MGFSASWYTQQHPEEQKTTVSLKNVTLGQFDNIVSKASLGNADRQAEAIERADGFSFQTASPWFSNTDANIKIVKKWLKNKGIRYATYPEIAEAVEELAAAGLVSVDDAAYASHLDGNDPKTFKGALTGHTFDSLESLIAQERQAAIHRLGTEKQTDHERAFDGLPIEEQQQMLRDAEKASQAVVNGRESGLNATAFLTLHPEIRDDEHNGKLLLAQLERNGVTGVASIADCELATRQLVSADLMRLNKGTLEKQQAQEVLDRAEHAKKHSAAFDTTSRGKATVSP